MSKMKEIFECIVEAYQKYHAVYTLEECEEIIKNRDVPIEYWLNTEKLAKNTMENSNKVSFLVKNEEQRSNILSILRSTIDNRPYLRRAFEIDDVILIVDDITEVNVYFYNPLFARSVCLPIDLGEFS